MVIRGVYLMKIYLLIFLSILSLMMGCEVLTAPFRLAMELLPLAIKYAPYALMFLELPQENIPLENKEFQNFSSQVSIVAQSLEKHSLFASLSSEWSEKKKNLHFVAALHLDTEEKVQKIQNWLIENGAKYQVRYCIVGFDKESAIEYRNIHHLLQEQKIAFFADGPLSGLKTQEEALSDYL